jgi:eukaryotic-like serine/threonine-protein kinase
VIDLLPAICQTARMGCPDENALAGLGGPNLPDDERRRLTEHLDLCDQCRQVAAALLSGSAVVGADQGQPPVPDVAIGTSAERELSPGGDEELSCGALLGRYRLEGELGAGAMGRVYAARDLQLERRVALKVIQPGLLVNVGAKEARARILREAQAMARLSHPNVVTVFDIGEHGEQVFVAMELSEGCTLAEWLKSKQRSRAEVLRAFVQAGRGLAEAHRLGIVHRDFKPENVLVDGSGKVRVTDFGLARAGPGELPVENPQALGAEAALGLTRTGVLVGTPGYMAPEQFEGKVDARSDQFAFCVALFEALTGHRPFGAKNLAELRERLRTAELGPRPAELPAWLWRVLRRGLSRDPEQRYPEMGALLGALERGGSRGRPVLAAGAGLVVGLAVVGAVVGGRLWSVRDEGDPGHRSSSTPIVDVPGGSLTMEVGEALLLEVPSVTRVAVGDPGIADVSVPERDRIRIEAGQPGKTTVLVWNANAERRNWLVHVKAGQKTLPQLRSAGESGAEK